MKAKKFLSVLCVCLIMSVVAFFGVMSVSAEEVAATTVSDNALDNSDAAVDESTDEDVTDDDFADDEDTADDEDIADDEDAVDDEDTVDEEDTADEDVSADDKADTEIQQSKPSPTTGDTATPISAFVLLIALSGTAVAGYKLKKSK